MSKVAGQRCVLGRPRIMSFHYFIPGHQLLHGALSHFPADRIGTGNCGHGGWFLIRVVNDKLAEVILQMSKLFAFASFLLESGQLNAGVVDRRAYCGWLGGGTAVGLLLLVVHCCVVVAVHRNGGLVVVSVLLLVKYALHFDDFFELVHIGVKNLLGGGILLLLLVVMMLLMHVVTPLDLLLGNSMVHRLLMLQRAGCRCCC